MKIIEITALENGAHRNQTGIFETIPDGFAVIPEDMEIPATFPFVHITVEDGIVTGMDANQEAYDAAMAEAKSKQPAPSAQDDTDAMLIDHEYRLTMLELGVTATE